jgi:hypothetical protein
MEHQSHQMDMDKMGREETDHGKMHRGPGQSVNRTRHDHHAMMIVLIFDLALWIID